MLKLNNICIRPRNLGMREFESSESMLGYNAMDALSYLNYLVRGILHLRDVLLGHINGIFIFRYVGRIFAITLLYKFMLRVINCNLLRSGEL